MSIIHVSGPTFAGKTHLISRIISDFNDTLVINFEKHFVDKRPIKNSYLEFYRDIYRNHIDGKNVICESIYSASKNPILVCNFSNVLNIVCLPSYKKHMDNLMGFKKLYGNALVSLRTGNMDLFDIRKNYIERGYPSNGILYDGRNYETIKNEIERYLCI